MAETVQGIKARAEGMPGATWAKRLVRKAQQDDVPGMSAEIAYHWIFAIPPLLILVTVLAALVDSVTNVDVVGRLQTEINERAPADTASVLNRLVDHAVAEVSGGVASLGVIVAAVIAIWSGSNGVGALIKAFNRVFAVEEERPGLQKRLVSIGLTLLLIAILNGAFVAMVYGRRIGGWLADEIGAGNAFELGWTIALWPLALVGIVVVLGILYWLGPDIELPFKWVSPGSAAATVLWLLLVAGFGIYLKFADPGSAYGVLGGVVVLMFFLYLTAMVILIGAEVNAIVRDEQRGTLREDLAEPRPGP
jgi:membrane protein